MNTEKYIVRLTGEERQKLETIVKKLKGASQSVKRAIVLLKHTRPIFSAAPASHAHPERVDYEYERNGTVSIFMFVAPFENWRRVSVREHRTKRDWVEEIEQLVMHDFASAKKVTIVLDNLNTHTKGA